jgi:glycosyltransferase involved in cell wall biosynthesis
MIGKGLFEKKFRYIPNGIKTVSKNQVLDENIMKQLPKGKFIIGYTGTIGLANALDPLIESAIKVREHKKIHFIFVGNGSNKIQLEKKVCVNNLENVTFINAIDKDQIYALIEYFDVCYLGWHNILIYKFGISANKLFDYMYAGKPILHAYSGTKDIVKIANAGISCEAYNVDEIVDSIYKFLEMSKNEMRKMGQNGKNYVLKYHTYEHLAKKYIEIFNDITDDMTIEGKGTNKLVIPKET